jgi:hypothetical protein
MNSRMTFILLALLMLCPAGIGTDRKDNGNAHPPKIAACKPISKISSEQRFQTSQRTLGILLSKAADTCKCYCGGQSWSPGSTACMGGYKQHCVDRNGDGTDCGWDTVKLGSDPVACDGSENCTQ